jgi:hypothetical protein
VLLERVVVLGVTLHHWARFSTRFEGLKCALVQVQARLFSCEDEDTVLLQIIGDILPNNTASHFRGVDPTRISGVSVRWVYLCLLPIN